MKFRKTRFDLPMLVLMLQSWGCPILDRVKTVLALASFGCLLGVAASYAADAETRTVVPKGEYAQIDTLLANETVQVLAKGTIEEKRKAIESIKSSSDR